MYNSARAQVQKEVDQAGLISFTSDIWTSMNNLSALLGVTVHWIDDSWNREMTVIQLKQMET